MRFLLAYYLRPLCRYSTPSRLLRGLFAPLKLGLQRPTLTLYILDSCLVIRRVSPEHVYYYWIGTNCCCVVPANVWLVFPSALIKAYCILVSILIRGFICRKSCPVQLAQGPPRPSSQSYTLDSCKPSLHFAQLR